jgi:hypothetical protein
MGSVTKAGKETSRTVTELEETFTVKQNFKNHVYAVEALLVFPMHTEHKASVSSHYFLKSVILKESGMELYNSSLASNRKVPGALSMAEKNLRHEADA